MKILLKEVQIYRRLFPDGIDSYHLMKRIKQLRNLFLGSFKKDKLTRSSAKVLILVHGDRFKFASDENLLGLCNGLKKISILFNLFSIPPSTCKFIEIENKKYFLDRADQRFLSNYILHVLPFIKNKLMNFWLYILNFYKPKVVFCYRPPEELCQACNKLDIFLIELQHGAVWEYVNKVRQYLPNTFLAWDKVSLKKAKKFRIANNFYLFGYPEFLLPEDSSNSYSKNKKFVLVTLTDNMNDFYKKYSNMSINILGNLCIRYLDKILLQEEFNSINWIFRFHPLTNKYEINLIKRNIYHLQKINKGLKVIFDNKNNLSTLIKISDFHITLNSSVAKKFLIFNKKTILTCPIFQSSSLFKELKNEKNCYILEENYNFEKLNNVINKILNSKHNNKYLPSPVPDINAFKNLINSLI